MTSDTRCKNVAVLIKIFTYLISFTIPEKQHKFHESSVKFQTFLYPYRVRHVVICVDGGFSTAVFGNHPPVRNPLPLVDELMENLLGVRDLRVQVLLYPRPQVALVLLDEPVPGDQQALDVIAHRHDPARSQIFANTKTRRFRQYANLKVIWTTSKRRLHDASTISSNDW